MYIYALRCISDAIRYNLFLNKISKQKIFFRWVNVCNSIKIEMEFLVEEIIREF